ncbi:3-hydroxyacyl-CoA dehydrogenase, C-terminal [Dillenia turbinata]|uniref:3-hydroxyacyl-CoA dehydrogenase, C-terminal n=1 Tax=Dillenia turbinata TaxID=194707 RepID=A0AAN8ZPQ6_9MAGN
MAKARVTIDVGNDGVAVITISNPPVNALAVPRLKEKFDEAIRRNDIRAIVLTGDNDKFSGGFDINVFQKIHETGDLSLMPDVSVDLVVNTIEDSKKPIVAAAQGLALGGGLELTMECHARIAAPKTQLGLPELTLGVIPGFGGTQRLLSKAIEMMLLSKSITSEEGKKLGLIDAIVPPEELLKVSRQWALEIVERRKPWMRALHRTDKIGSLSEAREIIKQARKQAKQTARNMPQHQASLDVIEEGIVHGGCNGVLKLVLTETAKGLVHFFFAQRLTSKVPNVTDLGLKPRPIKKVAVIGGGLMGSGIATALILSDRYVVLKEINKEYLQKGIKMIEANIRGWVAKGKLTQEKAGAALSFLKGVLDYSEFKDVDMAVIENIPLKQKIFCDIEKACPPHCILATNTSTIDLNKRHTQDRIIGAHFFSPAHVMPLLEIVQSEKTSAQVILDLMTVGKAIKKVPVVVRNCIGFACTLLVNLGVDLYRIDRVITNFGLPIGPFQLQDLAGYGVAVAVGPIYDKAFGGRVYRSPLLQLMMKNGRNGKNNGKGYYIYEKGRKPKPDPSLLPIIEESRGLTNIMPGGKPVSLTNEEILGMILFPVVNEACLVIDEGVVIRAADLDIASVLGMSFPSYRGGIVFWADMVGPKHIYESLKKWSECTCICIFIF